METDNYFNKTYQDPTPANAVASRIATANNQATRPTTSDRNGILGFSVPWNSAEFTGSSEVQEEKTRAPRKAVESAKAPRSTFPESHPFQGDSPYFMSELARDF